MATLLNAPICLPTLVTGDITVVQTYSNPTSVWNGSPIKFSVDVISRAQGNSDEGAAPNYIYTLNDISIGMWLGQPNGAAYQITQVTSISGDGLSGTIIIEDVDLYNLVLDNTGLGNNSPIENVFGAIFEIGIDGLPTLTPLYSQLGTFGSVETIGIWSNDLINRFSYRNYINDYFTLTPNTVYAGISTGDFVRIDTDGTFVKVTGTTEDDFLSIAGVVTSDDIINDGLIRIRPYGRIVFDLPTLVGDIGEVLYYDPSVLGNLTNVKPISGLVYAVYIKLDDTTAIFINKVTASGANGTSGTAGTSGTSGTDGSSGTSGTSGTDGSSGTSGTSGTDGSSGTSGTSGTDGSSGTSGTSGTDGSSGTSGTSGTDGSSGTSGTSGTDGSSGTSGTDGSSGTSGTSGTDGSSGTSGTSGTDG